MPKYLPDNWGINVSTRTPMYLRAPEFIHHEVNRLAKAKGLSNNEWVLRALRDHTLRDEPLLFPVTAEQLLTKRRMFGFRIERLLREVVGELAEERGVSLTVWILDALLSKMATISSEEG